MVNELQHQNAEQPSEIPQINPENQLSQPNKSNKKLWIILGIAAVVICIGSMVCVGLVVNTFNKVSEEQGPIESVLDTFMTNMAAKDTESAYALFSPRAQQQTTLDNIEEAITGNNYFLFDGYQSLTGQNLYISTAANTNPDLPQGIVAEVEGIISYDDGFTGQFSAVLEKVDGTWRIYKMNVTVPPNKFQP